MRPVEAIKTGFRKSFVFNGRASRSEFWFFYLFYSLILSLVMFAVTSLVLNPSELKPDSIGFWTFTVTLWVLAAPTFSAFVRRWHDTNHSGWWFIGICIYMLVVSKIIRAGIGQPMNPIAVFLVAPVFAIMIWLEVMLLWPGTNGPNRYGADPLTPNETD